MMRIYTFLNLLLFIGVNQAQTWEWARKTALYSTSFAADANDNIYVGFSNGVNSQYSSLLVKQTTNGSSLWTKELKGAALLDIKCGDNFIVVAGYFNYTFMCDTSSISNQHANTGFVAMFDLSGTIQWIKYVSGSNSAIENIVINRSNEIVIQGITGEGTFGGYQLENGIFLSTILPNGEINMTFQIKGNEQNWGYSKLSLDEENNIYYSGVIKDSVLWIDTAKIFTQDSYYGSSYIAKLESDGKVIWVYQFDGGKERIANLIAYAGGEVYFTTQAPYEGSYLRKLDVNGKEKWTKQVGAHLYPAVKNLLICADGDLVMTGTTWMVANFGSCSFTGTGDVPFLAKFDTSAECRWLVHAQASWSLTSDQVVPVSDGYVIRGRISNDGNDSATFGQHVVYGDYYLAKVSESTLKVVDEEMHEFKIFPNPTGGDFTICLNYKLQTKEASINITSLSGEKLVNAIVTANEYRCDLRKFPPGIYLVQLTTNEKSITQKIILMR
jgi:hypothetical protein